MPRLTNSSGAALPPFVGARDVLRAIADGFRPPQKVTVSECAERHRHLSNPGGGYSGPWRNANAPFLVEIMDSATSRKVTMLIICGPAQIFGKTEVEINIIAHSAKYDPAPLLVLQPTKDLAREFTYKRIERGCFDISRDFAALIGDDKSDDTAFFKAFRNGGHLTVAWPVPSQLASRPCVKVLIDEFDSMPDDVGGEGSAERLAEKRIARAGRNGKVIVASQPKKPHGKGGIVALFYRGDQRLLHWPCAQCGEYFTPGFDAERKPTIKQLNIPEAAPPDLARREARLICPHGCVLEERHKIPMLARAVWLPIGQSIDAAGNITGSAPPGRTRSYWFSGLAAPARTWGDLAAEFVEACSLYDREQDESGLKSFWNGTMGAPYTPKNIGEGALDPKKLRDRADQFPWQIAPADTRFVISSVDVQGTRFVVAAWAFLGRGAVRLIDYFEIFKAQDRDGAERQVDPAHRREDWKLLVDQVLEREYPVETDGDPILVKPLSMVVDTGGKKGSTGHAYDFWQGLDREQRRRVQLIKGGSNDRAPFVSTTLIEHDHRTGKKLRKGIKLRILNVDTLKDLADLRLRIDQPGPGFVHLPAAAPDRVFDELCAEIKLPGEGWQKLVDRPRNEAWDLFVYALGEYVRRSGQKINWENPPAWAVPLGRASPGAAAAAASAAEAPAPAVTASPPAPAAEKSRLPRVKPWMQRVRRAGFVGTWRS